MSITAEGVAADCTFLMQDGERLTSFQWNAAGFGLRRS
jgi:hypothetical protein